MKSLRNKAFKHIQNVGKYFKQKIDRSPPSAEISWDLNFLVYDENYFMCSETQLLWGIRSSIQNINLSLGGYKTRLSIRLRGSFGLKSALLGTHQARQIGMDLEMNQRDLV